MKKILLPSDFSEHAQASAIYAAHLSQALKMPVDIVHVTDAVGPVGLYAESAQIAKERLRKKLWQLSQVMHEAVEGDLQYDTLLLNGTTTSALASIALNYELIVMSAQGKVDLDHFFLGSTTKYMVQHSQTPILVVPPKHPFQNPKKIVWALDNHQISTSKQIRPLPEIARQFSAKVEIFHQDEGEQDRGFKLNLAIFLENINYSVHYDFASSTITDTILAFAESEQADLICMIHHRRSLLQKLLSPSKTLSSISKSRLPILILPDLQIPV
jgi:nucleotide-binding universal stress UspA family protein